MFEDKAANHPQRTRTATHFRGSLSQINRLVDFVGDS